MNTTRKALTGYKRMKDDELLALAATAYQAMTGNPNFPNPVPDLADFKEAFEDYQERFAFAKQKGGHYETSLKNDSREKIEEVLKQLAFHVNIVSAGNLSMILSSGFPLSAISKETFTPEIPTGLKLKDGRQSGYMRFDFDKVADTLIYEYHVANEKTPEGDFAWGPRLNTTSSINNVISPVIPGVIYFVRIRAVNGKGIGDWSEPVSLMAR